MASEDLPSIQFSPTNSISTTPVHHVSGYFLRSFCLFITLLFGCFFTGNASGGIQDQLKALSQQLKALDENIETSSVFLKGVMGSISPSFLKSERNRIAQQVSELKQQLLCTQSPPPRPGQSNMQEQAIEVQRDAALSRAFTQELKLNVGGELLPAWVMQRLPSSTEEKEELDPTHIVRVGPDSYQLAARDHEGNLFMLSGDPVSEEDLFSHLLKEGWYVEPVGSQVGSQGPKHVLSTESVAHEFIAATPLPAPAPVASPPSPARRVVRAAPQPRPVQRSIATQSLEPVPTHVQSPQIVIKKVQPPVLAYVCITLGAVALGFSCAEFLRALRMPAAGKEAGFKKETGATPCPKDAALRTRRRNAFISAIVSGTLGILGCASGGYLWYSSVHA